MNDQLTIMAIVLGILHSGIRLATPYLFASLGETFDQRSGVLNLGVEGIMLMGAFSGFYTVFVTGNLWLGVIAAGIIGGIFGLIMAVVSITFQAEQGISGIGLYMLGLGLSSLLFKTMLGTVQGVQGFPDLKFCLSSLGMSSDFCLANIPVIGDLFFSYSILTYIAFALVPISRWVLNSTTWGLKIRAVGQNPEAADSLGVGVNNMRYQAVILGGVLAGIAGASLSISLINIFQENMTNGMGFIAVALVYFGGWSPVGVLVGALLFSTVSALQLWVQVLALNIPSDVAVMLPYLLTIIVLALPLRRAAQPAALTKPFQRGRISFLVDICSFIVLRRRKLNKKYSLFVMLLMIALFAVACGGGAPAEVEEAPTEAPPTEAPAEEKPAEEPAAEPTAEEITEDVSADADATGVEAIRIAVVMPSTVTDLAWSQAIYDSLLRIQADAGGEDVVEIAYTENMFNVTDAAAAIRDYAADGFGLVIAHGTQYGSSLFEIAPDFPETSFAWGTAVDTGADQGLENVFAYEARAEEGGFVNGVLAANLSEFGVVGVVGPVEAGDAKLYIDGFVAGAKEANPDITVNVSYTGSFGDTALAAEAANTHIQAGADVLTGSAQQVVGAIGVASEQNIPWLGTQSDQSPIAPEIVVASQLYDWDGVLLDIIDKHNAGEFGGTAYALTLKNGGLVMDFKESLDADAVAAAQESAAEISSGAIDVMAMIEGTMAEAPAEEEMTELELPEIEPVRIALVMPSTTTDLAWSESIYDSLILLQEAYGEDVIEIAYTENMFNVTDAAAAIRDYADAGFNLVIAHGAQYGSSLFEIAPDFPDTSFAWGTTTNYGEEEGVTNVFAYEPRAEQGGYVSGVLAAHLTEAGIIGLVGPVDAGDAKLHVDGFVAGVRDTDPDITMNISFTGSFGDTALAAEAANTHIQAGADVLTGSSQQVAGAIGVAKENGVPWLGIQADQSPLAPDVVVATVLYDWRPTLLEMITSQQAGDMGGKVLQLTLENGGQTMIYADSLPADAVAAAKAAEKGIIDGSIEIVTDPR